MTKGEALARVASHVAGMIDAGTVEEGTGYTQGELDEMSGADARRLEDAMDVVCRRLWAMGARTGAAAPSHTL